MRDVECARAFAAGGVLVPRTPPTAPSRCWAGSHPTATSSSSTSFSGPGSGTVARASHPARF